MWASKSRGDKKNSEVLLDSNYVVEQISDKNFPFAVPEGKYILQLDGLAKDFFNQNIKVGDQLKIDYTIYPRNDYKMLIGGHGLLVDNGQAKKYTKEDLERELLLVFLKMVRLSIFYLQKVELRDLMDLV